MDTTKFLKALAAVKDIDTDDVLEQIGLQPRTSGLEKALITLGIFGAGLIVGAGIGMLASPVSPEEARKKLADGANTVKNQITGLVQGEEQGTNMRVKNGATTAS